MILNIYLLVEVLSKVQRTKSSEQETRIWGGGGGPKKLAAKRGISAEVSADEMITFSGTAKKKKTAKNPDNAQVAVFDSRMPSCRVRDRACDACCRCG